MVNIEFMTAAIISASVYLVSCLIVETTGAKKGTPLYWSARSPLNTCNIFGFPVLSPRFATLVHFVSAELYSPGNCDDM